MSRLPNVTVPAASGVDLTSDKVTIAPNRAQRLVNALFDRQGVLRFSASLRDVLQNQAPFPIDGLAIYEANQAANPPQNNPTLAKNPSLLLFVSGGVLYYCIAQALAALALPFFNISPPFLPPVPGGDPFGPAIPVPLYGSWFSLSGNTAFYRGERVRGAQFSDEVILVQAGGIEPQRVISYQQNACDRPIVQAQCGLNTPGAPNVTSQGAHSLTAPHSYLITFYEEYDFPYAPAGVSNPCTDAAAPKRRRESSPSAFTTFDFGSTPGQGHIAFSYTPVGDRSTGTFDHQIRGAYVYRSTANDTSTFYRVADVPMVFIAGVPQGGTNIIVNNYLLTGAGDDSATDAQIISQPIAPNIGENDPPNAASIVCNYKSRMVLNDLTNNAMVQISNLGSPTQFCSVTQFDGNGNPLLPSDGVRLSLETDQGDVITAIVQMGSLLWISTRRRSFFLFGDSLTDFVLRASQLRGCIATDSACRCDDWILYLSDDGVYQVAYEGGNTNNKISKEIEASLLSHTDAELAAACAWYANRTYNLAVGTDIYTYSFDAQGWGMQIHGSGMYPLNVPTVPDIIINPNGPPSLPPVGPPPPPPPPVMATVIFGVFPQTLTSGLLAGSATGIIPTGPWSSGLWTQKGSLDLGAGTDTVVTIGTNKPVNFPDHPAGVPGSYTESVAATSGQISDINAAAGGSLNVGLTYGPGGSGSGDTNTITSLTLLLTP